MTSIDERAPITLDYLKGKRRAEKALGFLLDVGEDLLCCQSKTQITTVIANHLARFQADLCFIDFQPNAGPMLSAAAQAPDLVDAVGGVDEIRQGCRTQARDMAPENTSFPQWSRQSVHVESTQIDMQQIALDHPDTGTGSLSVARLRPGSSDFSEPELKLLTDVAARYLVALRCLPV